MKIKNYISLLFLLLLVSITNAQSDSFSILKTKNPKFNLSVTNPKQTSIVITSKLNYHIDDSGDSLIIPNQTVYYEADFVSPPFISTPDNYTRYKNNNNYYNTRMDCSFSKPYTNPNFDPTNPWNTRKITDALVMGSLNTVFSLLNR